MAEFPYERIVTRATRRPEFRERLIKDPRTALQEIGISLPPDVEVRVVVDTLDRVHAVLPREPGLRGPETGFVKQALDRFRSDRRLHDLALADPKAAFTELTGGTPPKYPEVVAVEETRVRRVIHLPPLEARDIRRTVEPVRQDGSFAERHESRPALLRVAAGVWCAGTETPAGMWKRSCTSVARDASVSSLATEAIPLSALYMPAARARRPSVPYRANERLRRPA